VAKRNHLAFFDPALADAFATAPTEVRRQAVLAAMRSAMADASLESAEIHAAFKALAAGNWNDQERARQMERLAGAREEKYWVATEPYEDMTEVPEELKAPFMPFLLESRVAQAIAYASSGADADVPWALQEALEAQRRPIEERIAEVLNVLRVRG
jgi:hypothetical protein